AEAHHVFCCVVFQAEDGIRGFHVTGVQTCALPILEEIIFFSQDIKTITTKIKRSSRSAEKYIRVRFTQNLEEELEKFKKEKLERSEERRVGKECRCREWQSS